MKIATIRANRTTPTRHRRQFAKECAGNEGTRRRPWSADRRLTTRNNVKTIFVFSSDLAGKHNKSTALYAQQNHGAIYGQGEGLQGNSYAIATMNHNLDPLPLRRLQEGIQRFIEFASRQKEMLFQITAIGCDATSGYRPADIAPMFRHIPPNCNLCQELLQSPVQNAADRSGRTKLTLAEKLAKRSRAAKNSTPPTRAQFRG